MLDWLEVGDTEELFDDELETGRSWLEVREIELLLLLVAGEAELIPVGGLETELLLLLFLAGGVELLLDLILRAGGVVRTVGYK